MRMRTLREAHAALLESDPGCCLTMTALRRKVVSGEVPSVRVGQKYLVDLDRLESALFGGSDVTEVTPGKIRRVEVSA